MKVDTNAGGSVPPDPSEVLIVAGVEFSLVSGVYLILGGLRYVTQFRLHGRRLMYNCMTGITSASSFDGQGNFGQQVLYVYVRTDLLVVAGDSVGGPRNDASIMNSGLSPAFLRARPRVKGHQSV